MSSDDYIKLLFWDKVTNSKVLGTGDNEGNAIEFGFSFFVKNWKFWYT